MGRVGKEPGCSVATRSLHGQHSVYLGDNEDREEHFYSADISFISHLKTSDHQTRKPVTYCFLAYLSKVQKPVVKIIVCFVGCLIHWNNKMLN